ncbi:TraB/GumN family protein [Maribellus maritimus]|uniref:TraB/GumN family protein n=1 Tax=Maribellus maritimus TaxID=2870838 RepID=UPI001EEA7230|nr:TraB/GumN family protein [Maribellus maritimus]MCG6190037.1 TraB/GumN family protein [Maribellus maritimus]
MFKITSAKNQKISYIFGTHHAFGKPFFDALKNANQCLAASDLLIKENLNIPGHLAEDIINKRTDITKWNKYLNKDDLAYIKNMFATSPTDFNKMTPAEMYVFLNRYFKEQVCLSNNANGTHQSLDNYIGSIAEQLNIKQIGLETTEAQIELINKDIEGMPGRIHKKRLSSVIYRIKSKDTNGCAEIEWYKKMEFDFRLDQPCQNNLILADRNNKWLNEIKEHLQESNCFIVVGLSHLMFKCSLINQLQDLGYVVEPVKVK